MNTRYFRPVINENPNLALDVIHQQKQEGLVPTPLTVAWHIVAVNSGRVLPPPPRVIHL